jgi:hypothetical protein
MSRSKASRADVLREKKIAKAIDRTGHALYGPMWLGQPSETELKIGRSARPATSRSASGNLLRLFDLPAERGLPVDAESAQRTAKARLQYRIWDWQSLEVVHLLQQHGIDCGKGFKQAKFARFFRKFFPALTPRDRRIAAIKNRLAAGERPGRGGTVTRKKFAKSISADTGVNYAVRTIMRDVKKLS